MITVLQSIRKRQICQQLVYCAYHRVSQDPIGTGSYCHKILVPEDQNIYTTLSPDEPAARRLGLSKATMNQILENDEHQKLVRG